jgi:hypothetical protein
MSWLLDDEPRGEAGIEWPRRTSALLKIEPEAFHGDWNYVVRLRAKEQ